jgi:hypothetical protein
MSRLCFHYTFYVEFCHDYVFYVCGKFTDISEQSSQGGWDERGMWHAREEEEECIDGSGGKNQEERQYN